jgi:hypothetical protein
MLHDGSTNTCKLLEFEPEFMATFETAQDYPQKPSYGTAA